MNPLAMDEDEGGPFERPYYQIHLFGCVNERPDGHKRGSCARRGALPLLDYLKARVKEEGIQGVRVNKAMCLDRCELGPVLVVYPEGIWYHAESREDMEEILQSHIKRGRPVARLRLAPEQELSLRPGQTQDPTRLEQAG